MQATHIDTDSRLLQLLNNANALLAVGEVEGGMTLLVDGLQDLRSSLPPEAWRSACGDCLAHPIRNTVHQDPLTRRAFHKPRGYAGDAVTIDYYYGHWDGLLDDVTPLGMRLLSFVSAHPAAQAVRYRRDYIARVLDAEARRKPLRALSVASGHVREAHHCQALRTGGVSELVALDQDPESLALVASTFAGLPITPLRARIRDLLPGKLELGSFDLVYSLGLYDYLERDTARTLTERLASMLAADGLLVLANFLPEMPASGYSESFTDWPLVLRTQAEMEALTTNLDASRFVTHSERDPWSAVTYLTVRRRA
ncbi:MAG TPA: class I SAM-dependent methyltransferase [Polyangiales bacterium]|nr:class I SAM-dependent methyltransferase [Polyangiales bacterium]